MGVLITVTLIWAENDDKWHMYKVSDVKRHFIMDFPDCENMHRFFEGLDKRRVQQYDLWIMRAKKRAPVKWWRRILKRWGVE